MKTTKLLAVMVGSAFSILATTSVQATIMTTGSGLATPANFVDFETSDIADNTVITNQFASAGVTFGGIGVPRYNSCGQDHLNDYLGLSGDTLNTYGPGCQHNSTDDQFSIYFNNVVSEASFGMRLYNADGGTKFEALLNGVVQDTWLAPSTTVFNQYLTFSGMLFDEIRYYEGPHQGYDYNYLALDNLAFNSAQVPEPAPLALLGIGLLGLMASRSRRATV